MSKAPERIWAEDISNGTWWFSTVKGNATVEYVRADRIEALERKVKELREQSDRFCDKYLAALRRAEAAEATMARLSEALETIENVDFDDYSLSELHEFVTGIARAALSGSNSGGWPVPDGWKLVPERGNCEMLERLRELMEGDTDFEVVSDALVYVLAGAPAAPQPTGGE